MAGEPPRPLLSRAKSPVSTPDTFSLNVTVQCRLPVVFVGFASAVLIEETDGGSVSQLPVVHVTFITSVRVIVASLLFLPVAAYVTVPEPGPATDELTVTVEDTLLLSVLLTCKAQFDGSVIVFGDPICALRPTPVTD